MDNNSDLGLMNNRQRTAFRELLEDKIPKLLQNNVFENERYRISFSLYPVTINNVVTIERTNVVVIKAECTLVNKETQENQSFIIDLLNMPHYGELGFYVRGNYIQVLDLYQRLFSWNIVPGKSVVPGGKSTEANLVTDGNLSLGFFVSSKGELKVRIGKKAKVNALDFFRAISNHTPESLLEMFGNTNPFVVKAFSNIKVSGDKPKSRDVDVIFAAIKNEDQKMVKDIKSTWEKTNAINNHFFNNSYASLSESNHINMNIKSSFRNRALNMKLNQTIEVEGKVYEPGFILTEDILCRIDLMAIDSLEVRSKGKNYTLKKFTNFTFRALGLKLAETVETKGGNILEGTVLTVQDLEDINSTDLKEISVFSGKSKTTIQRRTSARQLIIEDLFTIFTIFADSINGLEKYDNEYELDNRIVIPFDKKVMDVLNLNLNVVKNKIAYSVGMLDNDNSLLEGLDDYSSDINVNSIIDLYTDPDEITSQMAELTNILSLDAKSYKITTNIKDSNTVKDALINVQNYQFGRLDPIDQPESSKIGLVHYRTILAKEDKFGKLTAPYFRVKKGKIINSDPIYLTAEDEIDKYIAAWDETFVEDDNQEKLKDNVTVKFNGTITTVSTDKVSYIEYSQLNDFSPARALNPFPGYAAPKRQGMGCNHGKQATPTTNPERAWVSGGVDSIHQIGIFRAKDVLESFYEDNKNIYNIITSLEKEIKSSKITLVSVKDSKGKRELFYTIDFMREYNENQSSNIPSTFVLEIPYMIGNASKGLFTYKTVPSHDYKYEPKDVIACDSSIDLREYELDLLVDYGGLKTTKEDFRYASGNGKNIMVAFKTSETVTIDDAQLISSELVDDEILATIKMQTLSSTVYLGNECTEEFEKLETADSLPMDHIGFDGLPVIGTILSPGDVYVCKTRKDQDANGVFYKSVPGIVGKYEGGQVVATEIYEKDNKRIAEVVLAIKTTTRVGDKSSGRHGNKGVVARIVPASEMPYNPVTGERIQMILSPLGVPSRMNISQLIEITLGLVSKRSHKVSIVSHYHKDTLKHVKEKALEFDVKPAMLCDGRTGQMFKRPINYGILYIQPLVHKVKHKVNAIGIDPPVDPVFLQPRKGQKVEGGQAFGEYELWCLASVGADLLLEEIYSLMSDNPQAKARVKKTLENNPYGINVAGKYSNDNDKTLQALLRCEGIELTNTKDGNFLFKPISDSEIRGLATRPIENKTELHSSDIFGNYDSSAISKAKTRGAWGWIDLKAELILPTYITKGQLSKLIILGGYRYDLDKKKPDDGKRLKSYNKQFSNETFSNIIKGISFLEFKGDRVTYYQDEITVSKYEEEFDTRVKTSYGLSSLVKLFKVFDVNNTVEILSGILEEIDPESPEYMDKVLILKKAKDFVSKNRSLKEYVVSSYPVIPQIFRPLVEMDSINKKPDFDYHYTQIFNAIKNYSNQKSEDNLRGIFNRIAEYIGVKTITLDKNEKKGDSKYQNLKSWFLTGYGDNKGKVRSSLLRKRLVRSGRSVITPTQNPHMKVTEIGIPFSMLVDIYETELIAHLRITLGLGRKDLSNSKWKQIFTALSTKNELKFEELYNDKIKLIYEKDSHEAYKDILNLIITYIEGYTENDQVMLKQKVMILGRQPSLHKYSIRAFYIKVVFTESIQLHPQVCTGFNADFDGDTTYMYAPISDECMDQAIRLLSPMVDIINPKDSTVILQLTQDVVLGNYYLTMLKDNVSNLLEMEERYRTPIFYPSVELLEASVETGLCEVYQAVCVRVNGSQYMSTAGRVIFNSKIPGGFTQNKFSNPLKFGAHLGKNFGSFNMEAYRDLKYDGLVTSKGGKTNDLVYKSLNKICEELYEELGTDCLEVYQKLTEIGFVYSDKSGITLSIEDMVWDNSKEALEERGHKTIDCLQAEFDCGIISESVFSREKLRISKTTEVLYKNTKEKVLKETEEKQYLLNKDYQAGLIDPDVKVSALTKIYKESNEKIKDSLAMSMPRNNNLFIMFDSGARGSASQIMQTCGSIGMLKKTKTEDMGTPIIRSYAEGLSSFDILTASYSGRIGVASTQNETRVAGEADRTAIYMGAGVKIVEDDCKKTDWWFDIIWGKRKSQVILMPSLLYFSKYLLGKKIHSSDRFMNDILHGTLSSNNEITEDSYDKLSRGFTDIVFDEDGNQKVFSIDIKTIFGGVLDKNDPNIKVLSNFLNRGTLNEKCINIIEKNHVKRLETSLGTFAFKYELNPLVKSLLLNREARNLPHLKRVYKVDQNMHPHKYLDVITPATIKYIEQHDLDRVEARILLDCTSKGGICTHCYGAKYSSNIPPLVGESVGYEAGQSMGEPASQLTMDSFHDGGQTGNKIDSGIAVFRGLCGGNLNKDHYAIAELAQNDGYVDIVKIDKTSLVFVKPVDENCSMCEICKEGSLSCGLAEGKYQGSCMVGKVGLLNSLITVEKGEYVTVGTPITKGYSMPNNIPLQHSGYSFKELIRMKQMIWVSNYFNTFYAKNITINARHFEIMARLQNSIFTFKFNDSEGDHSAGEEIAISEVLGRSSVDELVTGVIGHVKVVSRYSGPLAAISFQDSIESTVRFAENLTECKVDSALGAVITGSSLITNKPKQMSKPRIQQKFVKKSDEKLALYEIEPIFEDSILEELEEQSMNSFDDFVMNLDDYGDNKIDTQEMDSFDVDLNTVKPESTFSYISEETIKEYAGNWEDEIEDADFIEVEGSLEPELNIKENINKSNKDLNKSTKMNSFD